MCLMCERNKNLLENQNSAAFADNSAEFTDNSTTFTDNSAAFTDNLATRIPDALNEKLTKFLRKPAI
jgi:hypothetical protein